ncbi:MAG: hypothetical protein AAGA45_04445 [Verrucomicrobiota bacterium]
MIRYLHSAVLGGLLFCLAQALTGEVVVITSDGQEHIGNELYWHNDSLVLNKQVGDGQVSFQFPRTRIELVRLPGKSSDATLAEMEMHYQQCEPFLELLPRRDRLAFVKLVNNAYASGDDTLAVGVALRLSVCIEDLDTQHHLRDAILLGYARLELDEELQTSARQQPTRYSDSALGAYLLARRAYLMQDYETALKLALEPVVFSSQYPMAYLGEAYALAILAAEALDEGAYAAALRLEAEQRLLEVRDALNLPTNL